MSECSLGSTDLIFNPEPEVVERPIDNRRSQVVKIGKRCLVADAVRQKDEATIIDFPTRLETCSVAEVPVLNEAIKVEPEKEKGFAKRVAAITEMADTFADHDYVLHEVGKYRNDIPFEYCADQKRQLLNTAGSYNRLSSRDADVYFEYIDHGVELYKSGIDLTNLSTSEEMAVLKLVAARQVIIMTNLRLVMKIAKKYKNPAIDDVDLIEEGIIGLSKAVDRFDRSKGFEFSTYAHEWIPQGITRAINIQARTIRVPVHIHDKHRKVSKQIEKLNISLGREPTNDELLEATGMSVDDIAVLMQQGAYNLASIDAKLGNSEDEGSDTLGYFHGTTDLNLEKVDGTPTSAKLLEELIIKANLDNRRLFVVGLRSEIDLTDFGDFYVKKSDGTTISYSQAQLLLQSRIKVEVKDIGDILGMSRQYIRSLEVSAMERLKKVSQREEYRNFRNNED